MQLKADGEIPVTTAEGQAVADKIGASGFFEISATEGTGVEELLYSATRAAMAKRTFVGGVLKLLKTSISKISPGGGGVDAPADEAERKRMAAAKGMFAFGKTITEQICPYSSSKGNCKRKFVADGEVTYCAIHTCTKAGCNAKKSSKAQFCPAHVGVVRQPQIKLSSGRGGQVAVKRLLAQQVSENAQKLPAPTFSPPLSPLPAPMSSLAEKFDASNPFGAPAAAAAASSAISSNPFGAPPNAANVYNLAGDNADALHGAGNRFLDLREEDGEPRSPIAGLFPDTLRIPDSLDACLSLVANQMPACAKLIKLATKKARKVAKKMPQIPLHMLAAIVFYTIEDIPREQSPYYILNKALRAKSRKDVKLWRDYIWLLLHALKLLPAAKNGTVYRGMRVAADSLGDEYDDGEEFSWCAFSSTATTMSVMNEFVGDKGPRTMFNLELAQPLGRDLREFSLFPSENEILLPPNTQFKVVGRFSAGNGLTILQCKQVGADDEILSLSA